MLDQLIKHEYPNDRIARNVMRTQFTIKLLLLAVLLPILLTLVSEFLFFLDGVRSLYASNSNKSFDYRLTPVLATVAKPFFWCLLGIILGFIGSMFLPFLGILWNIPGNIFCTSVGLLLEITVLVPRMFLGCFFDLLLFFKGYESPPILFSRSALLLLAALLPTVGTATSHYWFTWYHQHMARATIKVNYENVRSEDLRLRKASGAAGMSDELDLARDATTVDEAIHHLDQAFDQLYTDFSFHRTSNKKQRKNADEFLGKAIDRLSYLSDEEKADTKQWQSNLLKTLHNIDSYRPTWHNPHQASSSELSSWDHLRDRHLQDLDYAYSVWQVLAILQTLHEDIDKQISDKQLKQYVFDVIKQSRRSLAVRSEKEIVITGLTHPSFFNYSPMSSISQELIREALNLSEEDEFPPVTAWYEDWRLVHAKTLRDITKISADPWTHLQ